MIKKRTRPQPRKREPSIESQEENENGEEEDEKLPYVSFQSVTGCHGSSSLCRLLQYTV